MHWKTRMPTDQFVNFLVYKLAEIIFIMKFTEVCALLPGLLLVCLCGSVCLRRWGSGALGPGLAGRPEPKGREGPWAHSAAAGAGGRSPRGEVREPGLRDHRRT